MNNSVETANEAGGRHPGHPGLHIVNEEAGHIVFHNEHVEHDMNDDTDERTKTMHNITNANGEQTDIVIENEKTETEAEAEGIEGTSTETTLNVAVEAAGGTGEELSETQHGDRGVRLHRGCRASCKMHTLGRRGRFYRGICQQRHERRKKTVKKQARQQQQMRLRSFQKRRGNPKTH